MPVLNGFCLFVKAEVVEAVGLMDEVAFPHGFGEENDFALRALAAGYSLKVADDVYVWHHKSKSYGDATRQALSAGSAEAMRERWENPAHLFPLYSIFFFFSSVVLRCIVLSLGCVVSQVTPV